MRKISPATALNIISILEDSKLFTQSEITRVASALDKWIK